MSKKTTNVAKATQTCGADTPQPPFLKSGSGRCFRAPKPKSINGAHAAGEAAAYSYLKHLRLGSSHPGETHLSALVEAIHYGSSDRKGGMRSMMAFGFLSTLDGWLRLATKSSEMDWIDGMSGEKINAKISGSLAMTEAQAKREFRSLVAKKAWADRKARESAAA